MADATHIVLTSYREWNVQKIHHLTPTRIYFGEPRKNWRGQLGQPDYIAKAMLRFQPMSEEKALAIAGIGNHYNAIEKDLDADHRAKVKVIRTERMDKIKAILG